MPPDAGGECHQEMLWQRLIPDLVRASLSSDFYDLLGDRDVAGKSSDVADHVGFFFRMQTQGYNTLLNAHAKAADGAQAKEAALF